MRGLTFEGEGSLWIPISNMNFDHPDPCNNTIIQMNRIAIRLRLWLRRAIKRINDRTVARILEYLHYARSIHKVREKEVRAAGWASG